MPRLSAIRRIPEQPVAEDPPPEQRSPGQRSPGQRSPGRRPHERRGARWLPCAAANVFVLLTGYLGMVGLIALVLSTAEGARFSLDTALVTGLAGWLAAYQVPLAVGGAALTPLPLVPTLLVMLVIAVASSRAVRSSTADRRRGPRSLIEHSVLGSRRAAGRSSAGAQAAERETVERAYSVVLSMALTHAVVGACIALLLGCASVIDAPVYCAAAATIASTAGVARSCGLLDRLRGSALAGLRSGLRGGLLGIAALVVVGLLVVGVALCAAFPRLVAVLGADPLGDAVGKGLLSVAYLPNAVLAGWSFAAGTGFSLGQFALRPFELTPGPVPELPLFAVLPEHGPQPWWAAAYALPLAVGALVGWSCRRSHAVPLRRVGVVAVASAVAAAGSLLLAGLAGGRPGGGAFDPMTLRPGPLAAATFCWIGLPAAAVAWFAGPDRSEPDDADAQYDEFDEFDEFDEEVQFDEDELPDDEDLWGADEFDEDDFSDDFDEDELLAEDELPDGEDEDPAGDSPESEPSLAEPPLAESPIAGTEVSARTVEEIDGIELESRRFD